MSCLGVGHLAKSSQTRLRFAANQAAADLHRPELVSRIQQTEADIGKGQCEPNLDSRKPDPRKAVARDMREARLKIPLVSRMHCH